MSNQDEIKIQVDGQTLPAKAGQMLIEVTDKAGITVPRFCYHKKLSVAANCRMCLVEVEKAPKPLPACATPVMDGMIVHTKSPIAIDAQKSTMEFLLINHPLDCPICDQGGECELQDLAMGYGNDVSRFSEGKRIVPDPDLGALIATDMTRCIHCTRCVRFGEEITGLRELGATGRGEHMKIGTYIQQSIGSELSANIIDLCPVGALTAKPSRYKARPWELRQYPSIASHDSFGSNLYYHVRSNRVIRAVPKNNETINECWLADRDRFSYTALYHPDRLQMPMLKENGVWRETDWDEAIKVAVQLLSNSAKETQTLISAQSTLEELYLAQKLTRALGSHQIEHRLQQIDFRDCTADPKQPWLGMSFDDLENQDVILGIGLNVHKDQPLLGHRLRKATLNGCQLMLINPVDWHLNLSATEKVIIAPSEVLNTLLCIAKNLKISLNGLFAEKIKDCQPLTDQQKAIIKHLETAQKGIILLGETTQAHPDYALIRQLTALISQKTNLKWGIVPEYANSVGAWAAGAVSHRLPSGEIIAGEVQNPLDVKATQSIILVNFDPALDVGSPVEMQAHLAKAESVIALTAFKTPALLAQAHVLLPIAQAPETSGTFINAQADQQSFQGVAKPVGTSRPAWKVFSALGTLLNKKGFEFESSQDVLNELQGQWESPDISASNQLLTQNEIIETQLSSADIELLTDRPIYQSDIFVRHAEPLQKTPDQRGKILQINTAMAESLGIKDKDTVKLIQQDQSIELSVVINDQVANKTVYYASGIDSNELLNCRFGAVQVEKV